MIYGGSFECDYGEVAAVIVRIRPVVSRLRRRGLWFAFNRYLNFSAWLQADLAAVLVS